MPDTSRRILFIGLGGSGVRTLERLKKTVTERMVPNTQQYVAFLAVDTDDTQLEYCQYLTREEQLCITAPDAGAMGFGPARTWSRAWPFVAPEQEIRELGPLLSHNGSGRKRLLAKLKLYSQTMGGCGVDEKLVNKLACIRCEVLSPLNFGDKYEIYVIAGISGGTGSGLITEMPGLLRQVFRPGEANIHAMVYLPDTMTARDPKNKAELEANGYAALKELEYYQSRAGKAGETAVFPYNGRPEGTITLNLADGYYTSICPVGSLSGPTECSDQEAQSRVAEYLTAIAFGAGNPLSFVGFFGLGQVTAELPKDLAWAWCVSEVLRRAGVAPEILQTTQADDQGLLPFLGEYQYESAPVLEQRKKGLLHPLTWYMNQYQRPVFQYEAAAGGLPTWQEVMDGSAEAKMARLRKEFHAKYTGTAARMEMEEKVQERFQMYRGLVQEYVRTYGPMSFVNLYEGNAEPSWGTKFASGIRGWLRLMVENHDPVTGIPCRWPRAEMYDRRCTDAKHRVMTEGNGLMAMVTGRRNALVAEWAQAYDMQVNAEINEARRTWMLGKNGILDRYFLQPAEELAKQIYCFGKVIEALAGSYGRYGAMLDACLAKQAQRHDCGMLAGLDEACHGWLMRALAKWVECVDLARMRNGLVDAFFDDPASWLRVDRAQVRFFADAVRLLGEPVNARRLFDGIMADAIDLDAMDLSLEPLFRQLQAEGTLTETAKELARQLRLPVLPRFHGVVREGAYVLLLPAGLQQVPGVCDALEGAFCQVWGVHPVVGFSQDENAIRLVRTAAVRFGWLREIRAWQDRYHYRLHALGSGLHGLSPAQLAAQNPDEGTPWSEYPDLAEDDGPF